VIEAVAAPAGRAPSRGHRLPLTGVARAYYLFVVVGAAAAGAASLGTGVSSDDWLRFAALAAAAAAANVFTVRTGHNHGFHTAIVFVVAAALLLPPELLLPLAVVQHVPEWFQQRYPWYIQTFNAANHALAALAAWVVADALGDRLGSVGEEPRYAFGGVAAAITFVCVNHVLLAGMLRLGRGVSLAESGLFKTESLTSDLVLAGLGVALAALWLANPWLVVAVVAPLTLSHRSFRLLGRVRDSEARFRTMFGAAPIGMIVRDLDGRILSTNPAIETMLGYAQSDLEGLDYWRLVPAEEAARVRELHDELVLGSMPGYEREQRFVSVDGREVWSRVNVTLVRDAGRRPQFVLAMVQDVTQHKLLEDQLRQAQKMEAIGRLAGGVAHDFNNILTAISGYANIALERVRGTDPALEEDVREIEKAARRAHALTKQLLAFSRKQVLQPQVLDLNEVVRDMEGMLGRLIGNDIEVASAYDPGLARVKADPGQLHQVIVNLVVNARDEMPNGGRLVLETSNEVIARADAEGGGLEQGSFVALRISDTGRGMDAETKSRLFEPFFTTKGVGKGTGLGLATVYGIVKQSGGFIDVESEPGEGATFTVYLPAVLGEVEARREEEAPKPAARGAETILLVEDEKLVRRYVATVLGGAGYRVLVADDPHEALELADGEPVDLLLTDVVMPKIGGPELAARLGLPVLYMSGYSGEMMAHGEVLKPGTAFIEKPFGAEDLKSKVRSVLDAAADASGTLFA
jgi:PAS domain S-box-containing protein